MHIATITLFTFLMGFSSDLSVGDDCLTALHYLRVEPGMQIESVNTLDDEVLVYTLTEGQQKAAVLACQFAENRIGAIGIVSGTPDDRHVDN